MKKYAVFAAFALVVAAAPLWGQQPSAKKQDKKPAAQKPQKERKQEKKAPIPEFELGEINIEAVIEKPNVDIFPKRVKVEMEEIAFIDRTFEREIKEVPKHLLLYDEELDSAKKLTHLRALLKKKQKKLKKK